MFIKSGLAQICAFVAFMLLYATTTNASSYVHKNNEKINDDILDIHMLPHAHCDTGWLETVQGYYDSYVHSILNTVVSSLYADKKLRFIWSEIKWLEMWWNNATEIQKKPGSKPPLGGFIITSLGEFVITPSRGVYHNPPSSSSTTTTPTTPTTPIYTHI